MIYIQFECFGNHTHGILVVNMKISVEARSLTKKSFTLYQYSPENRVSAKCKHFTVYMEGLLC